MTSVVFPLIVETLARLRSRSCIVDGEAVAFRGVLLEMDTFHRERRIPVRRRRSRREVKQVYVRFCFPDTATADAFRNRFGGECLTHAATSSD
jgi:hypothetical protein